MVPADQGGLAALLQYEAEVRRWPTVAELAYHVANETRRIVPYDQLFVLRHAHVGEGFTVVAASSVASVDRNAPLIRAIERGVATLGDPAARSCHAAWRDDPALADYPFTAWLWQPLSDAAGAPFAGLLFARVAPLRDDEIVRVERVAETVGHAWRALTGNRPVRRIRKPTARERKVLAVALIALAAMPVQMTALAPVEVVAARPFVVAAPYAGVVDRILVKPNARVAVGQPVLALDDTKVRNELDQAAQKLEVARARVEQSTSVAFAPGDETRDIAVARGEFDVARADYDYARDMMARSVIRAPRAGVAIYSDRRDWEGRAVSTGDPILQIVDPGDVEFRIDLPTREQMDLPRGNEATVWLDAQPLWSLRGRIDTVSYQSRETASGVLAFAVTARPVGAEPRIGSRGTAKVHGRWAPLAYVLLRRPIASLRQYIGL